LLPVFGQSANVEKKSGRSVKTIRTDILVVGGGTAGTIAAIQSGRTGCSTILVESGSQLGGTTTTGGVAFPGLFHAWGKQIISGIGWELVTEAVKLDSGELPDFSIPTGRSHWKHQIILNKNIYALLAEEKCLDAGVYLRFYETPVAVKFTGREWEVELIGKGTQARIICKQLLDCTGNALVAKMAGFRLLRDEKTQPGSQMFKMSGYDLDSLDMDLLQKKYSNALDKGEIKKSEYFGSIRSLLTTGHISTKKTTYINHVANADSTTSETHTTTNINGRSAMIKMLRFIKTLPGCENTTIHSMSSEVGIRETYRIEGLHKITGEEYITARVFDDAIAYSFYPIDVHDENGVNPRHLKEGMVPTISLKALIPEKSRNFMVAGRCISSDREANSALRVQASCMAMGQAAGATAAIAVKTKQDILDIPLNDIKQLILENGGIVPGN
jgi:hypothetical protein